MNSEGRFLFSLWIALEILWASDYVLGQKQETSACYGNLECHFMDLTCSSSRRIFILKLLYGSKPLDNSCMENSCVPSCCKAEPSDCAWEYTARQFGDMYNGHGCWNSHSCESRVSYAQTPFSGCTAYSTYAIADYNCLQNGDVTAFNRNTTITAPAVAIHYNNSDSAGYNVKGDNQTWHCQVDTADCVQRQADVILVKENYTGSSDRCSSMGWSGGPFLPCVPDFQYTSFNTSTPFHVSLNVYNGGRGPGGWTVVRAEDDTNLTVTCGFTNSRIASHCPDAPSMQPTLATQTPSNQGGSSRPSSLSSHTTSSQPVVTTSATSHLSVSTVVSSPSTSVTTSLLGTSASPVAASSTTGPIAGGAVAAVVVLVAAILGVFCYVKRCRRKPETDTKPSRILKSTMRMPLTSVSTGSPSLTRDSDSGTRNNLDDNDGDYDRIGRSPKPQNGHATDRGIHGNPRSPAEEPDYDLLGQKKSQGSSSNPAATYGRLGEVGGGGKDTDYNYDHLARGRQAAPDVINSDYDTAALRVTSEGDYNVAGIPKKQRVITGSDYDVAQIVTSEGDYNRVDFQGKKQRVITGSDYDSAEIVTSEGDYNRVDFQGRKQKIVTGSDYDRAEIMTSDNADDVTSGNSTRIKVGGGTYSLAKPILK